MAVPYNNVGHLTATTGQGTMTLGLAINDSYFTADEIGVPTGTTVSYTIIDGSDIEIGRGVYTASGTTLSRVTVIKSKIGGTAGTTKLNLSGSAEVHITLLAEDIGLENWAFSGVISPAQITADQNDYNPTGLATATVLRLDADADDRTITGIAGGASGRILILENVNTSRIVLAHDDGDSTAANRFFINQNNPLLAEPNSYILSSRNAVAIIYDGTTQRWRVLVPLLGGLSSAGISSDLTLSSALEGTLGINHGKQSVWVPATAMEIDTAGPAIWGTYNLYGIGTTLTTIDFPNDTSRYAVFYFAMPNSWNEGQISFVVHWTKTAGTGDMRWEAYTKAHSDGDTIASGAPASVTAVVDAAGSDNVLHITSESSTFTVEGSPATGDFVFLYIGRTPGDAADTFNNTAKLIGVKILYTVDTVRDN